MQPGLVAYIGAFLMCGFIGKSAQFPLHVWLPDAMAGPTPVSALIHAATMVAAGVYFLIRIDFLFTPDVLNFIAWLGTVVAVYAGFCAYAQNDIKRVLAYSTLSQLGYMAAAFGLGFPGIALFHLITHAFFKALLFLGAGSVIHGCHHEQDIFKMGGLLKRMPITSITFAIGLLALCGFYLSAGYFSKDAILIAGELVNPPIFYLLTAGAFLTAGYMGRLFWIAFLGEPKSDAASHAHESPLTMLIPLILLAVLSVVGGFTAFWPEALGELIPRLDHPHHMEGYKHAHHVVLIAGRLPGWWALPSPSFSTVPVPVKTVSIKWRLRCMASSKHAWSTKSRLLCGQITARRRSAESGRSVSHQGTVGTRQCRTGRPGRRLCQASARRTFTARVLVPGWHVATWAVAAGCLA